MPAILQQAGSWGHLTVGVGALERRTRPTERPRPDATVAVGAVHCTRTTRIGVRERSSLPEFRVLLQLLKKKSPSAPGTAAAVKKSRSAKSYASPRSIIAPACLAGFAISAATFAFRILEYLVFFFFSRGRRWEKLSRGHDGGLCACPTPRPQLRCTLGLGAGKSSASDSPLRLTAQVLAFAC